MMQSLSAKVWCKLSSWWLGLHVSSHDQSDPPSYPKTRSELGVSVNVALSFWQTRVLTFPGPIQCLIDGTGLSSQTIPSACGMFSKLNSCDGPRITQWTGAS